MRAKVVLIKSGFSAGTLIGYFFLERAFYPIVSTEQALKQFDNTAQSFTNYELMQQFWNFGWALPILICMVIFLGEFKNLYNQIRGGF